MCNETSTSQDNCTYVCSAVCVSIFFSCILIAVLGALVICLFAECLVRLRKRLPRHLVPVRVHCSFLVRYLCCSRVDVYPIGTDSVESVRI